VASAALIAVGAVSAPAGAQTTAPYPTCGGATTQNCVAAFSVNGGAPPAGVTLSVVATSTSVLTIQVLQAGAAQSGVELSPALSTAADIHVELNTGTFDPLMLMFTGAVEGFAPAVNSTTGNTASFDVSPVAASWTTAGCSADSCGNANTRADNDLTAVAVGQIVAPTVSSAAIANDLRGAWLETDAQSIGTPTIDPATDKVSFTLAAAHLKANNSVHDDGSFTLFLKDAFLTNELGFTSPATTSQEFYTTTRQVTGELTAEVTDTITRVIGGTELTVPFLRYSSAAIEVSRATTSVGRSTIVGMTQTPSGNGYWLVDAAGGVWPFGDAGAFGSLAGIALNQPIVGMASTPTGNGYYLVATDGGIFTFGDAAFKGSTGAIRLNQPIVGMATTNSGAGYWLVAADGGIFTFGDAAFMGSTGAMRLNRPVVGMEVTPSGNGYFLVASDGGIFTFGDAAFKGSTGSMALNQPIFAMEKTPDGAGYWLVAADGGVFTFGTAAFSGSLGSLALVQPITAMAVMPAGTGYRMAARDGGVFALGTATYLGGRAI